MSNMSYCKFQNTVGDLEDCWDSLDDENLSEDEYLARQELVRICRSIVRDYNKKFDNDYVEEIDEDDEDIDSESDEEEVE